MENMGCVTRGPLRQTAPKFPSGLSYHELLICQIAMHVRALVAKSFFQRSQSSQYRREFYTSFTIFDKVGPAQASSISISLVLTITYSFPAFPLASALLATQSVKVTSPSISPFDERSPFSQMFDHVSPSLDTRLLMITSTRC